MDEALEFPLPSGSERKAIIALYLELYVSQAGTAAAGGAVVGMRARISAFFRGQKASADSIRCDSVSPETSLGIFITVCTAVRPRRGARAPPECCVKEYLPCCIIQEHNGGTRRVPLASYAPRFGQKDGRTSACPALHRRFECNGWGRLQRGGHHGGACGRGC